MFLPIGHRKSSAVTMKKNAKQRDPTSLPGFTDADGEGSFLHSIVRELFQYSWYFYNNYKAILSFFFKQIDFANQFRIARSSIVPEIEEIRLGTLIRRFQGQQATLVGKLSRESAFCTSVSDSACAGIRACFRAASLQRGCSLSRPSSVRVRAFSRGSRCGPADSQTTRISAKIPSTI